MLKSLLYRKQALFQKSNDRRVLFRYLQDQDIPEAEDGEIFVYEDEGFSAKNLERPQFRLMMQSARKEPFDYIVVY